MPLGATVTLAVDSLAVTPPVHQWTLLSKPAGSTAVLNNPAALRPTFVADLAGDFVAQLVTSLSGTTIRSAPETVLITTARPPIDVAVTAPDNTASEVALDPATFTFTRTGGDLTQPLTILYTLDDPLGGALPIHDFEPVGQPFYFPELHPGRGRDRHDHHQRLIRRDAASSSLSGRARWTALHRHRALAVSWHTSITRSTTSITSISRTSAHDIVSLSLLLPFNDSGTVVRT